MLIGLLVTVEIPPPQENNLDSAKLRSDKRGMEPLSRFQGC